MANLLYYQQEREEFKDAFAQKIPVQAIEMVVKKLLRHYKLGNPYISYTSGRNHSCAGYSKIIINRQYGNDFGTICHEIAHVYQARKKGYGQGDKWHTKAHKRLMGRMIAYCAKKGWFAAEIARKTAPKPVIEVSEADMKAQELIKAQERIIRYEKKILFYQRKLSKAKRSYAMRNRYFQAMKGGQNDN